MSNEIVVWIPAAVAVTAAALIAMLAARPGYSGELTLWAAAARALASVLFAFLAALLALRFLCRRRGPVAMLLASAAAWTVPTALLWPQRSPWTAVTALMLVTLVAAPLQAPGALNAPRAQWAAMAISGGLQLGVILIAFDQLGWGAALMTSAVLMLATRWITTRPARLALPKLRAALSLLACLAMTLLYLLPLGGDPAADTAMGGFGHAMRVTAITPGVPVNSDAGVILFPELPKSVVIRPPLPKALKASKQHEDEKLLEIPFFGVYWFYPGMGNAPPTDSITKFGSATDFRFRTVNQRAIRMEARQNLGRVIPLSCCSRIDVWVRNAETVKAGSVRLELTLANTRTGEERMLDILPLRSARQSGAAPVAELLAFAIPGRLMDGFDELRTRFHLSVFRAHRSTPVAIERFVLVPRRR